MVTGLWPEHHGVVANTMWDSEIGYTFEHRQPAGRPGPPLVGRRADLGGRRASGPPRGRVLLARNRDARSTACARPGGGAYDPTVPQSRTGCASCWPGSAAGGFRARRWCYSTSATWTARDTTFGPDAPADQIRRSRRVDSAIGGWRMGSTASGLTDMVDLVVVSDHGMAPVEGADDLPGRLPRPVAGGGDRLVPVAALAPRGGTDAQAIYAVCTAGIRGSRCTAERTFPSAITTARIPVSRRSSRWPMTDG